MRYFSFFVLVLSLTIACNESRKSTKADDGYTSLFDGKTLNGWRTYQNKTSDSWTVKDGSIYCKGSSADKSDRRADLITADTFTNFDLSIDWKISPQGNSGICIW